VINRFQSLPFKCNLQRYIAGPAGKMIVVVRQIAATERQLAAEENRVEEARALASAAEVGLYNLLNPVVTLALKARLVSTLAPIK
jgi:hypothetical protein